MKQRMQNSYEKGLATRSAPESCADTARDSVKRRQGYTASCHKRLMCIQGLGCNARKTTVLICASDSIWDLFLESTTLEFT